MKIAGEQQHFVKNLLKWNLKFNNRQMPWKGEKDPYKIWLSEIILQQTRVDQGLEYYNRFVIQFPTVTDLANASETIVFKLWEGLGYYTRCKNLIATARYISNELNGKFPDQYEDILALKGIGPYTAAAIGSFAFNLPHAVVDGNVFRVLSRYFAIATPTDSTEGKKFFTKLANELIDKKLPGIYNQAIMDFGAVICKPQLPLCASCILGDTCIAYNNELVQQLPIKEKSIKKTARWLYYLVIEMGDTLFVRKRGAGDVWENLYEFVVKQSAHPLDLTSEDAISLLTDVLSKKKFEIVNISPVYKQLLTHQIIQGQFIYIKMKQEIKLKNYEIIPKTELNQLPFPKFISIYLKDKNVSLNLCDFKKNQHSIELIPTT
ncbi:MAG: A/G-specific adenine glycosylase [Ferruginibacter sp.]